MDMFPQTTKQRKRLWICSHARKISNDIQHIPSCHVETCVLLSKLKSSKSVSIELDLDDFEITAAEARATYGEIKEYILNKYGFKVSSLNIAQVKQECGIIERENYNKPSGKYRQPKCPEHKFNAIKEALEHFKMI